MQRNVPQHLLQPRVRPSDYTEQRAELNSQGVAPTDVFSCRPLNPPKKTILNYFF